MIFCLGSSYVFSAIVYFWPLVNAQEPSQIHIHLMPWLFSYSVYFKELTTRYAVASYTQFVFNCTIQFSLQPFLLNKLLFFFIHCQGNLDKSSSNAGYVILMFYHLYEGKVSHTPSCSLIKSMIGSHIYLNCLLIFQNRKEFEGELIERFGSLVKIPLLRSDRYIFFTTVEIRQVHIFYST